MQKDCRPGPYGNVSSLLDIQRQYFGDAHVWMMMVTKQPTSLALVAEWCSTCLHACPLQNKVLYSCSECPIAVSHPCLQPLCFALCKMLDITWCLLSGQATTLSGPQRAGAVRHATSLLLLQGAGHATLPWVLWAWTCVRLYEMGFSHFWHPLRGIRIGEASQPGPMTAAGHPLRRLHSKQSVEMAPSTELEHAPSTELSEPVLDSPMDAMATLPEGPETPNEGSPAVVTYNDASVVPAAMEVFLVNGQKGVLKCNFLPSVRSWRWQIYPRKFDMARESRANIQAGLQTWLRHFRAQLTPDSCVEVDALVVSLSSHPSLVTPCGPTQPVIEPPTAAECHVSTSYRLPEAIECDEILRTSLSAILEADITCQHHLPNSVVHEVTSTLLWLHKVRMANDTPIAVSQVAEVFLICAPRLLWPLPLREKGQTRLAPHSRPRVILQRISLLRSGQWLELWRMTMFDRSLLVPQEGSPPPVAPGVVTPREATRIATAVRQGSLTKAWKQLWSYGRAPRTYDGAARTWHKLNDIMEQPPQEVPGALSSDEQLAARALITDASWKRVLQTFHSGKSPDGLGWSQNVWAVCCSNGVSAPAMRRLFTDMWTQPLHPLALQLTLTSKCLGLNKNKDEAIRPLSIPTCWRRAQAILCVQLYRAQLISQVGSHQYGCGRDHGIVRMSREVSSCMEQRPNWLYLQLDVKNAFSSMHKSLLYSAFGQVSELLSRVQRAWLFVPNPLVIADGIHHRQVHTSATGIPQGDPLSSWGFALGLNKILEAFVVHMRDECGFDLETHFSFFSYLDDIVLACDPACATTIYREWAAHLARAGLLVQPGKMQIHSPASCCDPFLAAMGLNLTPQRGLLLCGLPGLTVTHLQDRAELAVGKTEFIVSWLTLKEWEMKKRISALVALAPLVSDCGCHVALHLLRCSLVYKFQYILAALHADFVTEWASRLTKLMWKGIADVLEFSSFDPSALAILALPTSHGGWGFLDLKLESPLIFLSQALSLRAASADSLSGQELSWSAAERLAIATLNSYLDGKLWQFLGKSEHECLLQGLHKAGRRLRHPIYDLRVPMSYRGPVAGLAQPVEALVSPRGLTWRQLNHLAMAWWHFPEATFVPNAHLRMAMRARLKLPLQPEDEVCYNFRSGAHRVCYHNLDSEALHSQVCCRTGVTLRHNSVRDALLQQCRLAGWAAQCEQLVQVSASRDNIDQLSRHRCDLLAIQPSGQALAIEVGVTSFHRDVLAQSGLSLMWREKCARYAVSSSKESLPGGEKLITFVASAWGALHLSAWELLLQLGEAQAAKVSPTEVSATSLLWRKRATAVASIQRALMHGQWRILQQSSVQRLPSERAPLGRLSA